jgi:hypothetical protein
MGRNNSLEDCNEVHLPAVMNGKFFKIGEHDDGLVMYSCIAVMLLVHSAYFHSSAFIFGHLYASLNI